jgi:hypothetical protein
VITGRLIRRNPVIRMTLITPGSPACGQGDNLNTHRSEAAVTGPPAPVILHGQPH